MRETTSFTRKLMTRLALVTLMLTLWMAGSALAGQATLRYSTSLQGAGQVRAYHYVRGVKTYYKDLGGYWQIDFPVSNVTGTTVYFETTPNSCYTFTSWQSDLELKRDEKGIYYFKFIQRYNATTPWLRAVYKANHSLKKTARKAATCEQSGNKKYFTCTRCGKMFSDKAGTKQIQSVPTIKAKQHKWANPVVKREPTRSKTGVRVYTCSRCGKTRTETIPALTVDPVGENVISPDYQASLSDVEKAVLKADWKKPVKGATYGLLQVKGKASSQARIKLTWKKVGGASKYVIYGQRAGKKCAKIATVSGKNYAPKKTEKGKYYKYVVAAIKGDKVLAVSKPVYVAAYGGKAANVKTVTVEEDAVGLKVGQVAGVSGEQVLEEGKFSQIRGLSFESSNIEVATVTKKGSVTGVKAGTCVIHIYAQNGAVADVQATVVK